MYEKIIWVVVKDYYKILNSRKSGTHSTRFYLSLVGMSGQGWVGSIVYLFFSDITVYHARGRKQSPGQAGSQFGWEQLQAYRVAGVGGFSKSLSVIVLLSKDLLQWYLMKQLSKTILFVLLYCQFEIKHFIGMNQGLYSFEWKLRILRAGKDIG